MYRSSGALSGGNKATRVVNIALSPTAMRPGPAAPTGASRPGLTLLGVGNGCRPLSFGSEVRGCGTLRSCSSQRLRVAVLGEDDHPLVVPPALAVSSTSVQVASSHSSSALGLGVRPALGRARPSRRASRSSSSSSASRLSPVRAAARESVLGRLVELGLVLDVLVEARRTRRWSAPSSTETSLRPPPERRSSRWTASVWANAAGDENNRFLSSSVHERRRAVRARLGAVRACRAARRSAPARRGPRAPRRCSRPRSGRSRAWGTAASRRGSAQLVAQLGLEPTDHDLGRAGPGAGARRGRSAGRRAARAAR